MKGHSEVFIISDTHFGHEGMCRFVKPDGSKVRPFENAAEMDEFMVERWNSKVGQSDKVYHLGDFCIPRKSLKIARRLNGKKILIKGNHDIFKIGDYMEHFADIRAFHMLNGCILTHAPIHPMSLERFGCNIHGHTHLNEVRKPSEIGGMEIDANYLNMCVELTDFSPLHLDEVFSRIISRGGSVGFKQVRRKVEDGLE